MYPPASQGDNPMAMESIKERLWAALSEKKDQNKDGKNDFDDVKIARMKASGMSHDAAVKKVTGKSPKKTEGRGRGKLMAGRGRGKNVKAAEGRGRGKARGRGKG